MDMISLDLHDFGTQRIPFAQEPTESGRSRTQSPEATSSNFSNQLCFPLYPVAFHEP